MTTIYLIRHAEAEGNLYRIAQGQGNCNLTDRGWRQVRALERRFRDIPIHAVYASDLYRTCATASAVYKPKGLPLNRRSDLREIGVGCWEHQTWGEIYRTHPLQMDYFSHKPSLWSVDGGEAPAAVLERVRRAVTEIAMENEGRTAAVFSHGYAIRLLLGALEGCALDDLDKTPTGDNTAVSCLEWENGALRIVFRDDNSHLKTAEYLAEETGFKRAHALEPGLWFRPPVTPEERAVFAELAEALWKESGESLPFLRETLLADDAGRVSLLGWLRETPVGLVQLEPATGGVALLYIREEQRRQGFGAQLIGQAVQHTRAAGGGALRAQVRADSAAQRFFADYGFCPVETAPDGRTVMEKCIAFDPEFL